MQLRIPALVLPFLGAAACDSETRSFSVPLDLQMRVKNDKKNDVVTGEKSIGSQFGDPFGVFIEDVRRKLGHDPATIDVERVDLDLSASSAGAASLGEVFSGTVSVLFHLDETGSNYPVATGEVLASIAGPLSLDATFDADVVPDADYLSFLGGRFKVSVTGPATPNAAAKPIDVDLRLTLTFAAFE